MATSSKSSLVHEGEWHLPVEWQERTIISQQGNTTTQSYGAVPFFALAASCAEKLVNSEQDPCPKSEPLAVPLLVDCTRFLSTDDLSATRRKYDDLYKELLISFYTERKQPEQGYAETLTQHKKLDDFISGLRDVTGGGYSQSLLGYASEAMTAIKWELTGEPSLVPQLRKAGCTTAVNIGRTSPLTSPPDVLYDSGNSKRSTLFPTVTSLSWLSKT